MPGVQVAGKTGTAELERHARARRPDGARRDALEHRRLVRGLRARRRPRIAVGVLLVRNGAGGETAAPAARLVLGQALGR